MDNKLGLRYRVVDVFTEHVLEGNPLAVFPEAAALDDATMQKIAKELNLSETSFVFAATRPDCAACVRIFTPTMEMTFAGHPTIGTAWVLLDENLVKGDTQEFALEEKVGAVPIRVEAGARPMIWLRTPPIRDGRTLERRDCAQALGLNPDDLLDVPPQVLSAGNPTLYIAVRDVASVDRSWLDVRGHAGLGFGADPVCVFVFAPTREGAYSRMFAPELGVVEDPATGSSTGPLAAYMIRHGLVASRDGARFISEQGTKMGRRSLLHVQVHGDRGSAGIDVGGHVAPLVEATMYVPVTNRTPSASI